MSSIRLSSYLIFIGISVFIICIGIINFFLLFGQTGLFSSSIDSRDVHVAADDNEHLDFSSFDANVKALLGDESDDEENTADSKVLEETDIQEHSRKISDNNNIRYQVKYLKQIKISFSDEVKSLEERRHQLMREISKGERYLRSVRNEFSRLIQDLEQVRMSLNEAILEKKDLSLTDLPVVRVPKNIYRRSFDNDIKSPPIMLNSSGDNDHNFLLNLTKCPLFQPISLHIYEISTMMMSSQNSNRSKWIDKTIESILREYKNNSKLAESCVFFAFTIGLLPFSSYLTNNGLSFLNRSYANHIFVDIDRNTTKRQMLTLELMKQYPVTIASIKTCNTKLSVRNGGSRHICIPPILRSISSSYATSLPYMLPVKRDVFLLMAKNSIFSETLPPNLVNYFNISFSELSTVDSQYVGSMNHTDTKRHFVILNCYHSHQRKNESNLCYERLKYQLGNSTFSLIVWPKPFSDNKLYNRQHFIMNKLLTLISMALKNGAIPVILYPDDFNIDKLNILPFSEIIRWESAILFLQYSRLAEVSLFLRTFSDGDILNFRKQGRHIFTKYLQDLQTVFESILATVRIRLKLPPLPVRPTEHISGYVKGLMKQEQSLSDVEVGTDEILGPSEPPFPSISFARNFSFYSQTRVFDSFRDPFRLYPSTPFEPVLSTDAKFMGSPHGFRPINDGYGGSGKEFSRSLGGNLPREQFTIVILTYHREKVLLDVLRNFRNLPYLNKVVVVWNSPDYPGENLIWPNIGVPIEVIKSHKNSLNNRFLPYDTIVTDAILSLDDDVRLRHDEIIFAFRAWRQERDRIVGFPGRFHYWNTSNELMKSDGLCNATSVDFIQGSNSNKGCHHWDRFDRELTRYPRWDYQSCYACELSMILTGAAFFHKYYMYEYSYNMPQEIRSKVDELGNCEDIAFNFLVSHITQKPPMKVTSRWTFYCADCSSSLSLNDTTHFQKRGDCINYFSQVYGYNPLLYTQYRLDSVLFKTKLSPDHQKCFKYV